MPLIVLDISEGCLKAITTVIYKGKAIVDSPRINNTIGSNAGFNFRFIITAPPFYQKISSVQQK